MQVRLFPRNRAYTLTVWQDEIAVEKLKQRNKWGEIVVDLLGIWSDRDCFGSVMDSAHRTSECHGAGQHLT